MPLLPKDSLEQILKVVDDSQEKSDSRLILAIPKQELLAYYESRLLLDVLTLNQGLLMTMAIPFASRQTAFTVYKAIVVPLPQMDEDIAIKWDVEAENLAVSENMMETSLVTRDQLDKCFGSSKYRICHETLATENKDSSCLATLYFGNIMDALEVCDTVPVPLPLKVKATNLGYGIWLITSAQANFDFKENYMDATTLAGSKTVKGCRICLITLECGKQLTGENIRIRSDLSSCAKVPPVKLEVELPQPMANLFSLLPTVEELPYYNTKVEANMKLLKSLKLELQAQPQYGYKKNIQQIAEPIAQKLTMLKPSLEKQFNNYISWKSHLMIGIAVFILSALLHLGLMLALHRYKKLHKFQPFSHKLDKEKIPLKPIMVVEDQHLDRVQNDENFQWGNHSLLLPESQLMEAREESAPTYA